MPLLHRPTTRTHFADRAFRCCAPSVCTRWTLKHYTVALLVDLDADLKHYFSVRHSVARLELSASASEVIRHAGTI